MISPETLTLLIENETRLPTTHDPLDDRVPHQTNLGKAPLRFWGYIVFDAAPVEFPGTGWEQSGIVEAHNSEDATRCQVPIVMFRRRPRHPSLLSEVLSRAGAVDH